MRASDVVLEIQADKPSHAVSPRLYGIFFEDINFGADGGLSAELVKNGALEFPRALIGWSEAGDGDGELLATNDAPSHVSSPTFLRVTAKSDEGFGAANEGFRGMGIVGAERYVFTALARTAANETTPVSVRLVGADGDVLAEQKVDVAGSDWHAIRAELKAINTSGDGRLQLVLQEKGHVDFDMVSLCPKKTWKGRPRGLRADLVQMLAELEPAFFRFPGGCIVEGSQLKYRYQWKATLGDPADRRLLFNRWNTEFAHRPTHDYFQSFAVGFFEYFQLCEDMGAEPMPILNCGMACQFNSKELVPLDELEPYIQDALDLIEFANGSTDTKWGARRAVLGHPAPFNLRLLGIGNEQWGEQYFERYELFAKALKERHPEIELISGAGPSPTGADFDYAWSRLRSLPVDVVDEHCYAGPDWFLKGATRYDGYNRRGPKVFMGEYAAQSIDIVSPDNKNNLRCALAEAAFLTGLERNSDIVAMSSYAPLFGHEDAWQWRPNLIWFDSLRSYATPNYYVQQLFSQHRADEVLPLKLSQSPRDDFPGGRIGVGSINASAEFKDIRVVAGGEVLFDAATSAIEAGDLETFRGRWETIDGALRQGSSRDTARALFGDYKWRDYTLSLKARKTGGAEGFALYFRGSPGGSHLQWNLGSAGNKMHAIDARQALHVAESNIVAETVGSIEEGRWYDVKVELDGPQVRCFLDGELVHDVTVQPLVLPQIYAVAGRDKETDEIVIKAVNVGSESANALIKVAGGVVANAGTAIQLSGDPAAVNSLDEPNRVAPTTKTLRPSGNELEHKLPAHSLTVLRISTK